MSLYVRRLGVVFTYAKIQIWKQFTTTAFTYSTAYSLCLPMQRYKFESNSQLWRRVTKSVTVVFTYAKIQIWKQFTTIRHLVCVLALLCLPMQRYKFESNSQLIPLSSVRLCVVFTYAKIQIWKQFTTNRKKPQIRGGCVYLCKDTNLKAIHNPHQWHRKTQQVVFTYAKIQIWKRFTTH